MDYITVFVHTQYNIHIYSTMRVQFDCVHTKVNADC